MTPPLSVVISMDGTPIHVDVVEILIYGLILFTSFQTVRGSRSSL
jgi:hypothetical protein